MKMFLTSDGSSGYLNQNTSSGHMGFLQDMAKRYFQDNPESTEFRVAVVDFDTREHSIIEIVMETTFDISEY